MHDAMDEERMEESSEGMAPAIDTHVHFWKYDRKKDAWITNEMKLLRQDFLPEHVALNFRRNGIEGCVAVQVDQSELENYFLAELAKTHPVIKGVVGWVDLRADGLEGRLQHFSEYPVIKGYRHIVQGEAPGFLLDPRFRRGVEALGKYGYTYDILVYHHQLKDAADFVQGLSGQKLVIDHCAKPDIRNREISEWRSMMRTLAANPNVYCKVSGLLTEAAWKNWSAADFYPYLDVVFGAFGAGRLMFGSDWPVMLLSGIYVQWKSLLEKYMESYTAEDREKVFRLNAIQFYNLEKGKDHVQTGS